VDVELILDAAETEAPGLRDLARRFLEAEAGHLGVALDLDSVLVRRAEGVPEVHIPGAADRLLEHLVATGENALADDGIVMALARVGAQAIMTRAELEEGRRNSVCH